MIDSFEQVRYFYGSWVKFEWDYMYDVVGRLFVVIGRVQFLLVFDFVLNQFKFYSFFNGLNFFFGIIDGNFFY